MNNFLKLAYEAGAQLALEGSDFTKEAFGEGMGYRGLDLGTTLRNFPQFVRADLADAGYNLALRKADAARASAGLRTNALKAGGQLLGAAVGATPGLFLTPNPLLAGAGGFAGATAGGTLAEMVANKGVRDAMLKKPGTLELLREYLKGNTPTGRFARRAGIAGLAGLGAAGLYNLAKDD